MPGDEHGTTWAGKWKYQILENSEDCKSVRMEVIEKGTKLREEIDISIYLDRSYDEANVCIYNPKQEAVQFAH